MIEIKNLIKKYISENNGEEVVATNDLSFTFNDSGFYFVLGKSGCGKTTLLNIMSGLDNYNFGDIIVDGKNIKNFNERELDEYRNIKIGIIFQQYNLLPDMNVYDNLRLVLELQEWDSNNVRNDYIDNKISAILERVGLAGYENRNINQLSGGEQQRIAIARTLLKNPNIIFADEPTGNLDQKTGEGIMQLLKSLSENFLIIMVTHDKEYACKYGDYILNMLDGKITKVDEVENKNLNFSFTVTTSGKKYNFDNLCMKDMMDEIGNIIFNTENGETVEVSNIKKCREKEEQETYPTKNDRTNIRVKKLSNTYKLRLSFEYLKKRKVRLFFTTLITTLSVILFFFSLYINFYDKEEVILKYMSENSPGILPIYTEVKYEDDFYVEHNTDIKKGAYFDNKVYKAFADVTNITKCISETEICCDTRMFSSATVMFCDDFSNFNLIIEGTLPESVREVVITDYVAKELNVDIGEEIQYQDYNLKVSGIIKTDYIEYQLDRKLNYGSDDEFFQFKCKYSYFTIYAKKGLLYENNKSSLTIQYADFFGSKKDSVYFNSFLEIGNIIGISDDELIKGRLPQNNNEIVVSNDFVNNHSLEVNDVIGGEYFFKNIHEDIYNNYYSDYQNMYDYFKDGVLIVGIIDAEKEDSTKDIYISEKIWTNILHDYYEYYYTDVLLMPQQEEYKKIVSLADEMEIMFDEPAINNIVWFDMTIQKLEIVLLMILIVVLILNLILIGTFVNISINENKRNIGVLRSLGVPISECMQIFSIEFYIIYIFSICLATMSILLIIGFVNNFYSQGLGEVKYDIIKFNVIVYIVVISIECLMNYISTIAPIKKIKKQKPIETIK